MYLGKHISTKYLQLSKQVLVQKQQFIINNKLLLMLFL